ATVSFAVIVGCGRTFCRNAPAAGETSIKLRRLSRFARAGPWGTDLIGALRPKAANTPYKELSTEVFHQHNVAAVLFHQWAEQRASIGREGEPTITTKV